jgi:ankyrin repeat protein
MKRSYMQRQHQPCPNSKYIIYKDCCECFCIFIRDSPTDIFIKDRIKETFIHKIIKFNKPKFLEYIIKSPNPQIQFKLPETFLIRNTKNINPIQESILLFSKLKVLKSGCAQDCLNILLCCPYIDFREKFYDNDYPINLIVKIVPYPELVLYYLTLLMEKYTISVCKTIGRSKSTLLHDFFERKPLTNNFCQNYYISPYISSIKKLTMFLEPYKKLNNQHCEILLFNFLLGLDIDINSKNAFHQTALMNCISFGNNQEFLKMILTKYNNTLNINDVDPQYGFGYLHFLCSRSLSSLDVDISSSQSVNSYEYIKIFVEYCPRIDVNLKSKGSEYTPLHIICKNTISNQMTQVECICLLIKYGALINELDAHGYTPSDYADIYNLEHVSRYLKTYGGLGAKKFIYPRLFESPSYLLECASNVKNVWCYYDKYQSTMKGIYSNLDELIEYVYNDLAWMLKGFENLKDKCLNSQNHIFEAFNFRISEMKLYIFDNQQFNSGFYLLKYPIPGILINSEKFIYEYAVKYIFTNRLESYVYRWSKTEDIQNQRFTICNKDWLKIVLEEEYNDNFFDENGFFNPGHFKSLNKDNFCDFTTTNIFEELSEFDFIFDNSCNTIPNEDFPPCIYNDFENYANIWKKIFIARVVEDENSSKNNIEYIESYKIHISK